MARRVVASCLLALLLLLDGLVDASDVLGALKDRNHSSHSAVALIFAFGLGVIVVIIAVVVLTLCCCDRPPPKRQHYVAAAAASGTSAPSAAGAGAGGGGLRYDRVVAAAAPAAPAAGPSIQDPNLKTQNQGPHYHGLLPRTVPPNGSRYPRVHSPFLV